MRSRVSRSQSRREFNRREAKTHRKNLMVTFRGGIRL